MHAIDWAIVAAYVAFAIWVGTRFRRRAGSDVDEFFLSGRRLPWWLAGTSMVATSFAADTPLVVTGWVRDAGIWRNWLWWCFAIGGMLTVFGFSRWWRRGLVMTKAELVELRYGGAGARALRGFLGLMHAGVTNTITICWVLLAAAKIGDVLFGMDKVVGLSLACAITLSYSLLAGFWGVVVTDLVQLTMAFTGAIALAVISWSAVGGHEGVLEAAAAAGSSFGPDTLRVLPHPGDTTFWTYSFAAFIVYLTVSWWAIEEVDGSGTTVQRISASRDERQGMLAVLWYNVLHFGFRPWPWIVVALASLIVLPHIEVHSQQAGIVREVTDELVRIETGSGESVVVPLISESEDAELDWQPRPLVEPEAQVEAGQLVARTDSERAYVVMMRRYLPIGLLGIAVASLIAALMSTIDTHVNLAASFFVNDFYRRFLVRDKKPKHYVLVARIASVIVMLIGALFAVQAESISSLFLFLLAFFSGVGPIYILRWLWWRVRASTEITAMVSSATATIVLTLLAKDEIDWPLTALTPDGELAPEGRLILVVAFSLGCSLISIALTRAPDPAKLVPFYSRVRPVGWWGPVKALAPDAHTTDSMRVVLWGTLGGIACVYGTMLTVGWTILGQTLHAVVAAGCAILGAVGVARGLAASSQSIDRASP